jgi:hypothetical protein
VPGFADSYIVSAAGVVASVDRVIRRSTGEEARYRGVVLAVCDGGVTLSRGGCRRGYSVSRLVGSAWRGTPCVVCAEVVSTRPHPWACSACDYTPPQPVEPIVDLDALGGDR